MPVETWIARLGDELGLGPLPIADAGACEVWFENGAAVAFELSRDREMLLLHAAVAPVPVDVAEQGPFLETLLSENHVESSEAAWALAIDPVRDEAVLFQVVGETDAPDDERFVELVKAFVHRAAAAKEAFGNRWRGEEGEVPEPAEAAVTDPLFLHARFLRA
jgi:hypothetical protein